jgi:hypothetical protein
LFYLRILKGKNLLNSMDPLKLRLSLSLKPYTYCGGVEWVSRLMLPVQYSGKRERF